MKSKSEIQMEKNKVKMLAEMLVENVTIYNSTDYGCAGYDVPHNRNASKTAILNQITTLRNELLVLADCIK